MKIPPDALRATDQKLLRCGARASALRHPNPEPCAALSPEEEQASHATLLVDLIDLHAHIRSLLIALGRDPNP